MPARQSAIRRLVRTSEGATMVEYAIMLMLIAVVCVAAVGLLGTRANAKFADPQLTTALR